MCDNDNDDYIGDYNPSTPPGMCGFCEKEDNTVEYQVNPFACEIYGDENKYWICYDCSVELHIQT